MENFSLLHPTNSNASYRTLNKEALNDLSVDYTVSYTHLDVYKRQPVKAAAQALMQQENATARIAEILIISATMTGLL